MSAKGLPPAVRLDPLLPVPLTTTSPCCPHYAQEEHQYDAKPLRPPPPSYTVEAPTSMSKTPPISSSQVVPAQKPRGLTPFIITPSSSRAHTPVQLLPLPPALELPIPCASLKPKPKKIKLESKVEPVVLEPLLPSRREETPKVMGVIDDEEVERCERLNLRRGRNDERDFSETNHQLPTPQTTPLTQALDRTHIHGRGCDSGKTGEEPKSQSGCPQAGKTANSHPLHLDRIRPICLDSDCHSRADTCCPERGSDRGKLRDVDRGRKRERGPSRFRTSEDRHRPGPYDPRSRPNGQKEKEKCAPRAFSGKLNLGQIAAAAALVMNETDQAISISPGSTPAPSIASSVSSSSTITTTCSSGHLPSTIPHQDHDMSTPDYRTTTNYLQAPSIPPSTGVREGCRDTNHPSATLSQAIRPNSEELEEVCSHELQVQLARERERLYAVFQRERERLIQARVEVEREWERMRYEHERMRGEVDESTLRENEMLKRRVEQLQDALSVLQSRGGQ